MWGEIETPAKTQPLSFESEDKRELTEKTETQSVQTVLHNRTNSQQPPQQLSVTQGVSGCANAVVEAVALSGNLVKSQQIGEAELTLEERRQELLHQFQSRPLVFLERYHSCLKPQHLSAFSHVSLDPRAQHYSKVIQRRAAGCPNKTRVRNHRYAALRALQKEGQYFSEEQMRMREPLLYEQYIGQYLTDEEILERSQEAMLDDAQGGSGAPGGGTGGLAHLLLDSYQERLIQNRLQEEQEREECAQEEDEDEDEEGEDNRVKEKEWAPTPEEKALLKEEFISQMHQHFLDGKDKDFNYSEVDENPDYDNLDIVTRDAEDKYFDEDDEEEEEEEEEEEMESDKEEENMKK
ncbi:coiled-coil domain-containing protein 97 isoform X1 [Sphaeramia orbicularis]|uniref:coiled-coil domain-containing protein 97 isoform X1 n=1 Tax=Sphaeramia orbicularis TaxID=375764 RepID=UPI00117FE790|nr:coiled-coil domain-containing protein 97 isoform X1 [Sphaeramia orbicularis]